MKKIQIFNSFSNVLQVHIKRKQLFYAMKKKSYSNKKHQPSRNEFTNFSSFCRTGEQMRKLCKIAQFLSNNL